MWDGEERRSSESTAARAVVAAKAEADSAEAALEKERKKRFPNKRRLKGLERDLRDIRRVERRCLEALGGGAEGSEGRAPTSA
jgi:hypothetical protein